MSLPFLSRRTVMAGLAAAPLAGAAPAPDIRHAQDFDELWETLRDRYAYFADKPVDWLAVRRRFRPLAVTANDDAALARVLERALTCLFDPHTHLNDPPVGTPRYPPFDLDVIADAAGARVRAVLPDSAAAAAGLRVGDIVTRVGEEALTARATRLAPMCQRRADAEAWRYALGQALSGAKGEAERKLTVVRLGHVVLRWPDLPDPPLLAQRRVGDVGIIAISSFGDPALVPQFDAALAALDGVKALVIDVRGNGGGDTAVARPIMGRFTAQRKPYAMMRRRAGAGLGPAWMEYVDPRGPLCSLPVAVVVDRWSASMAEGFPMGMKAVCGARVVGQPMMGLGAAVFPLRLDRTGISLQYSAEPVFDVAGSRRDRLQPDVLVPDGEDGLEAIVRLFRQA